MVYPFFLLDSGGSTTHYDYNEKEPRIVFVRNEKEEFQKSHCANCYNGIITETQFDDRKALEMLGDEAYNLNPGASMAAHLQIARFRFPEENFDKVVSYTCPYAGSCEGDKNVTRTGKSISTI